MSSAESSTLKEIRILSDPNGIMYEDEKRKSDIIGGYIERAMQKVNAGEYSQDFFEKAISRVSDPKYTSFLKAMYTEPDSLLDQDLLEKHPNLHSKLSGELEKRALIYLQRFCSRRDIKASENYRGIEILFDRIAESSDEDKEKVIIPRGLSDSIDIIGTYTQWQPNNFRNVFLGEFPRIHTHGPSRGRYELQFMKGGNK